MSQAIEIKSNGESIGSINMTEDTSHLSVSPTATGFRALLPMDVSLKLVAKGEPIPLVSNLEGVLLTSDSSGLNREIGRLHSDERYSTASGERHSREVKRQGHLTWVGTYEELAAFEKIRAGREPQFQIVLRGELCYLVAFNHPRLSLRTEPESIYGETVITYPKEAWVQRFRALGILENVLIEIPLPSTPPAQWDEVWKSLVEAREAFERGGTTGWKGCITAVRIALEKWRDIEKPDMGPGWKTTPGRPEDRTKNQRLDNLRWHLHQCTHFWVHSPSDNCSRDDALLMLSTLSALLANRNP